jgi:hypothetical protein
MLRFGVPLLVVTALVGCSEVDNMPYQGRFAQTALECDAAYQGSRQRQNQPQAYTGGGMASLFATSMAKGMVKGMTESQYNSCLARVAGLNPAAPAAPKAVAAESGYAAPAARPPLNSPGCAAGGGVMQGGAGYCIGN